MRRIITARNLIALVGTALVCVAIATTAKADSVSVYSIEGRVSSASSASGYSAISDGRALFIIRNSGRIAETLLDSARVIREFDKQVKALKFAQDGKRLAVAHKKKVSVLDTDSGVVVREFGFPREVYWVDWLANDSDLVAVCGKEATRVASYDAISNTTGDSFSIMLARADGSKPKKLYARQSYHPNLLGPSMTEDRRHMTFSSREGMGQGIRMIVSFDSLTVTRHAPPEGE